LGEANLKNLKQESINPHNIMNTRSQTRHLQGLTTSTSHLSWLQQVITWATDTTLFTPNLTSGPGFTKAQRAEMMQQERQWGNRMLEQESKTGNWTTQVGEKAVKLALEAQGRSVTKPERRHGFQPDWETQDAIWEVKTRTWTVSGTAGEKILGTPYKYAAIPRLYGKPLKIVCVAYQEWEAREKFGLFEVCCSQSPEQQDLLNYWKQKQITYVPFSGLVASTAVP
jgi:hypothetical protein